MFCPVGNAVGEWKYVNTADDYLSSSTSASAPDSPVTVSAFDVVQFYCGSCISCTVSYQCFELLVWQHEGPVKVLYTQQFSEGHFLGSQPLLSCSTSQHVTSRHVGLTLTLFSRPWPMCK